MRLRPNYTINVFNELEARKKMNIKDHKGKVPALLDEIEMKKAIIDEKDSLGYPEKQYIRDIMNALLHAPCAPFRQEIQSKKIRWLDGNPDGLTRANLIALWSQRICI